LTGVWLEVHCVFEDSRGERGNMHSGRLLSGRLLPRQLLSRVLVGSFLIAAVAPSVLARVTFEALRVPMGEMAFIPAGPDEALCFQEFPIPTENSGPYGMVTGSDGALWFTESFANQIGRITTAGDITEFPIPTPRSLPTGIATGPDGAVWFTEYTQSQIGRITTAGDITEFPIPTENSVPSGLVAGPMTAVPRAMWFTESSANKIGAFRFTGGPACS
jgi:streptogramin lyase